MTSRASSTRSPGSRRVAARSTRRWSGGCSAAASATGPLDRLSPRERDVLAAMAEGKSNHGIAEALVVSEAAVEKHVTSIFHKLGLDPAQSEHRRVLAVLAYLRDAPSG